MQKINALEVRQSLGKVLKRLQATGKPILVERDRKPAAVLISIEEYKRRFVDEEADDLRRSMVEEIRSANLKTKRGRATDLLRGLRGELP